MNDYSLTVTSLSTYKPIVKASHRSYSKITSEIRKRLGEECASFFAEPVPSAGNDIDWRCSVQGTPNRLVDLEENQKKVAITRYNTLRSKILNLAEELIQSRSNTDKILGESLRNALTIPSEADCIYIISPNENNQIQPVIVNWAYEIDNSQPATNSDISIPINTDTKNSTDTGSTETNKTHKKFYAEIESKSSDLLISKIREIPLFWINLILWTTLVFLIFLVIWLLIEPCGLSFGNSLNFCPKNSESRINAENKRQQLQRKIFMLERELFLLNNQCVTKRIAPIDSATPRSSTNSRSYSSTNDNNFSQETLVIPNENQNNRRFSEQSDETNDTRRTIIIIDNDEPDDPNLNEEIESRQTQKGAEEGEMTLTLIWNNKSDLDLALVCPSSDEINFNNAGEIVEGCGGYLQFDANASSRFLTDEPIEYVKFTKTPIGKYQIMVSLYRPRENHNSVDFTLQINYQGDTSTMHGNVSEDNEIWKHEYSIESQL